MALKEVSIKNLSKISDSQLITQLHLLVAEERRIETEVLWHLKEIETRKIHLKKGYSTVFEYAVKELRYSEGAAGRRVSAMRLLKELPEISEAIQEGSLNLSSLSSVQAFFKREKNDNGKVYSAQEKRDLIFSMKNKSKRECDKILATLSPESTIPREHLRQITSGLFELRIVMTQAQLEKLEKLKGLLSHQNPSQSWAGLLEVLSHLALERVDPEKKEARILKRNAVKNEAHGASKSTDNNASKGAPTSSKSTAKRESNEAPSTSPSATPPAELHSGSEKKDSGEKTQRIPIPAAIERLLFIEAGCQCTFVDTETQRRCEAKSFLQIDHIIPLAHGGTNDISNLRVLCFQHNQLEAILKLGKAKMQPYLAPS